MIACNLFTLVGDGTAGLSGGIGPVQKVHIDIGAGTSSSFPLPIRPGRNGELPVIQDGMLWSARPVGGGKNSIVELNGEESPFALVRVRSAELDFRQYRRLLDVADIQKGYLWVGGEGPRIIPVLQCGSRKELAQDQVFWLREDDQIVVIDQYALVALVAFKNNNLVVREATKPDIVKHLRLRRTWSQTGGEKNWLDRTLGKLT